MTSEKISVHLRFYEELNDFLPPARRKLRFTRILKHHTTVKDVIESCGVPHTEVDLILVNGKSEGFDYRINAGDDISVYPVFETFNISGVTHLQGRPLRNLSFLADANLGILARKLRLLGLNVELHHDWDEAKLASASREKGLILLTRDRRLLMRRKIQRGYYVRSMIPRYQTLEVIRRFNLRDGLSPFSRCSTCNHPLEAVPKAQVREQLKPLTQKYYVDFSCCTYCGLVYWQGAHYKKLAGFVNWIGVMAAASADSD